MRNPEQDEIDIKELQKENDRLLKQIKQIKHIHSQCDGSCKICSCISVMPEEKTYLIEIPSIQTYEVKAENATQAIDRFQNCDDTSKFNPHIEPDFDRITAREI